MTQWQHSIKHWQISKLNFPLAIAETSTIKTPMTIFKSAKVTELEARVSELEIENAALAESAKSVSERNDELAGANERISELETANLEIPVLNAQIAAHEATIADNEKEIAALTEKVEISQSKIGDAASQLLAAQGHGEPVSISGAVTDPAVNTLTRAEFVALTPKKAYSFIKGGGNLID